MYLACHFLPIRVQEVFPYPLGKRGITPIPCTYQLSKSGLATASIGLTWAEVAFIEIQQAHPGIRLQKPDWEACPFAWTTLEAIQVEPRQGRRKKRRFCRSRQHWKSFPHVPGGKKVTELLQS
jgi:hypothetical protein